MYIATFNLTYLGRVEIKAGTERGERGEKKNRLRHLSFIISPFFSFTSSLIVTLTHARTLNVFWLLGLPRKLG